MGIVLALVSSVLWGIGDFAGGTAAKRLPVLHVVVASQATGLIAVCAVASASGAWSTPLHYLPWAMAAGAFGVVGLLAFYEALARGTMGVVSPIAALSVVVPVAVGLILGQWPPPVVGVGFALAIVGVVAASGPERAAGRSMRPVVLALVAAVCFGAVLIFIARGAESSPVMTMVAMRVTSVGAVSVAWGITATRRRQSAPRDRKPARGRSARLGLAVAVGIAGVFDVGANLTYAYASTFTALTIVAILGSLYPAVTVVLARAVHGERMTRVQQAGIAAALAGVMLIAGWS